MSNNENTTTLNQFKSLSLDEKLIVMYMDIHNQKAENKAQMSEIQDKLDTCLHMSDSLKDIESKLDSVDARVLLLEYKSIDIEARGHRHNLLFNGFPENRQENCPTLVQSFIRDKLGIEKAIVIDRAHRLGRFKHGNTRPVIAAFRDFPYIDLILSNAGRLRSTEFGINRDYPKEISNARRSLWGKYKEQKTQNPHCRLTSCTRQKLSWTDA